MSIKTDGVISGLATTSLIKELSSAASRPKKLLESKISSLNTRNTAYSTINSLLTDIKTSLTDIQAVKNFRAFTTTVPSAASSYFSATADGTAIAGNYSIQTTQLAKGDMHVLNAYSSTSSTIRDGTLKVKFNANSGLSDLTTTININSTDGTNTLGTLASTLNAKVGISSYVLNDGSSTSPYRLVVIAENTGKDYTFTLDYTATGTATQSTTSSGATVTFGVLTDSTATISNTSTTNTGITRVLGQNAEATINSISVESSTNVFSDVISGITITALGDMDDASVAAQDVSITLDTSTITGKIKKFVDAYNSLISFYPANNQYNATTGAKGVFVGDGSIRNIINQVRSTVSSVYDTVSLDSSNNLDTSNSFINANNKSMQTSQRRSDAGTSTKSVVANVLSNMGVTFNSSTGKLAFNSTTFTKVLGSHQLDVEAMFSKQLDTSSNALSFSSAMEGLIKGYTLSSTGTIAVLQSNTSSQIKSLQNQVTRWEKRIKSYEARLYTQFNAMERIAGNAQNASSFLSSYFATTTK
ncbi:MAG: flagellar filament capping protein FliD [Myxococcota bacterium]|nr:flagellar filament capping protein FliD [Myxococcota bacterium]